MVIIFGYALIYVIANKGHVKENRNLLLNEIKVQKVFQNSNQFLKATLKFINLSRKPN